jgi:hypothetical protein
MLINNNLSEKQNQSYFSKPSIGLNQDNQKVSSFITLKTDIES